MFKKISDRIDEKAVAIIEWIQKKVNSDYDKLQAYPGLCTKCGSWGHDNC